MLYNSRVALDRNLMFSYELDHQYKNEELDCACSQCLDYAVKVLIVTFIHPMCLLSAYFVLSTL